MKRFIPAAALTLMAAAPALATSYPSMDAAFGLITYDRPVSEAPVVVDNNCALSEPESFLGHPVSITTTYPDLPVHIAPAGTVFLNFGNFSTERFTLYVNDEDQIVGAYCM